MVNQVARILEFGTPLLVIVERHGYIIGMFGNWWSIWNETVVKQLGFVLITFGSSTFVVNMTWKLARL